MKYRLAVIWAEWEQRHEQRLTYRELSRATGVSTNLINRVLSGQNVTVETLEKLAAFFGVPVRDLLDEA
jgi:transcriptional regulator with XRE-family HTH domain